MRVAVVGGGIGGLTAALALKSNGFDVLVFEQAGAFREVGAALGVGPNAVKVLRALGLEQELINRGYEAERFEGRNWTTGESAFRVPMKGVSDTRYGAGHYQILRADLLDLLVEAVTDSTIQLDNRCVSVSNGPDCAFVTLSDGRQEAFDLVVGCDGLHSVVRATLHALDAPRFTGNMCFRAMIPASKLPPNHILPQMTIWIGPNGHIVTYLVRGGTMVNLVAFMAVPHWVEESWSNESAASDLVAAYPGVHSELKVVLDSVDRCFKWGLFDRDPLPTWSQGRITLLGDAAHPMLPFLGQGAAAAIEDGYVLARELALSPGDIGVALQAYEAQRIPRTSRIQLAARNQERFVHQSNRSSSVNSDWLYEFDATKPPG
ncbi:MAG: FAD-dependent monooxygenase [Hyphomicrobiales bacterium]